MLRIRLYNESNYTTAEELSKIAAAIEITLLRDFKSKWGRSAAISVWPQRSSSTLGLEDWVVHILDDSSQGGGVLGYHSQEVTSRVFAGTIIEDGGSLSEVISHEIFEMLVDPHVNFMALDPSTSRLKAVEVCDPVEGNGYTVDGVLISDWVKPNWFDPETDIEGVTNFNLGNPIKGAWALTPNGYVSYLDLKDITKGWQEVSGAERRPKSGPHADRIIRRSTLRVVAP